MAALRTTFWVERLTVVIILQAPQPVNRPEVGIERCLGPMTKVPSCLPSIGLGQTHEEQFIARMDQGASELRASRSPLPSYLTANRWPDPRWKMDDF